MICSVGSCIEYISGRVRRISAEDSIFYRQLRRTSYGEKIDITVEFPCPSRPRFLLPLFTPSYVSFQYLLETSTVCWLFFLVVIMIKQVDVAGTECFQRIRRSDNSRCVPTLQVQLNYRYLLLRAVLSWDYFEQEFLLTSRSYISGRIEGFVK